MNRKITLVTVLLLLSAVVLIANAQGESNAGPGGPGLHTTPLIVNKTVDAGTVSVWNSPKKLIIQVESKDGWQIQGTQIYVGYPEIRPLPVNKAGNPVWGHFPYTETFKRPVTKDTLTLDLKDDLGFSWGSNYDQYRTPTIVVHADLLKSGKRGRRSGKEDAWAYGPNSLGRRTWGWTFDYLLAHPMRGQFIDSPVIGLGYHGPTQRGITSAVEGDGGFLFFPGEEIEFAVGQVVIGTASAGKKVSPLDLFPGGDIDDREVKNVAWLLQSLDADGGALKPDGKITIIPEIASCLESVVGGQTIDFSNDNQVSGIIDGVRAQCNGLLGTELALDLTVDEAKGNLEAGLNQSNIFRKNISKTEEFAEDKQKLEVMPVYLPGLRSNGDESLCVDANNDGIYDPDTDIKGVPYEEWRLDGDKTKAECDPRYPSETGEVCEVALIECREVAKPLVVTYREVIDIYDPQVNEEFEDGRFSTDIFTAISRDDGTTWKRTNVSRMADLSSFDLETDEPFPGTNGSPYLKIDDNYILNVWESKFCRSGNPRYAITTCDDPATTDFVETPENGGCQEVCSGNPDKGTEVCEPDYPYDDDYFITDIWGVRGSQQSVNYDEVDDVAELGIGEIPYSCLWAARGVIVTEKELADGTFDSISIIDDKGTPDPSDDEVIDEVHQGDIVWYKPERLTSGRRDAYIPAVGSARGAGFAIAWQEDPTGLRPGKGKGPGEGWSGAISNHKTDIWYSYISSEDFARVDENFVSSGPGDDPNGEAQYDERPGFGRPKALVPFSLPVRVSDNDMANTDTLKVQASSTCVTPPGGTEPVCFPEIQDGTYVPLDPDVIANLFCDGPSPVADCCDHDNHHDDPNCAGLEGLHGNLTGTKRYAYLAQTIDEYDNDARTYMPGGDGEPDYQYYVDRGGTLDLCDSQTLSAANLSAPDSTSDNYMDVLPGVNQERWFGFANVAGASKLVCVSDDGRLLDGDVSASRPNIQLQPYTNDNGTPSNPSDDFKSAWVLLGYEESKGLGHSLAASEHTDNPVDEIIGDNSDESGQEKPVKQDLGKNVIYHSFDFSKPDLVSAGHIVNLPALCGGLYPTYCDDPKTPDIIETNEDNPTCSCEPGQPVPLYFDYLVDTDNNPDTPDEWIPDDTKFLQYRTEIARRTRFIAQSYPKVKSSGLAAAIIYKQGQEGQGRPADVFIRRIIVPSGFKPKVDNPFAFENFECQQYLDETFTVQACPNDGVTGYNCNVWGEASGDRLCGGYLTSADSGYQGYPRRDHINLTSADVTLAVDAGPDDDTPEDPTDDRYGTNKVLLWTQNKYNLGDESYGYVDPVDGTPCDVLGGDVCPAMYSNSRSHRGFVRGNFLVTAFAYTPNWAAARNGNDRYNFYVRRSFDGGLTWETNPEGDGVYVCAEWRADPTSEDPDGTGNPPPEGIDPECTPCLSVDADGNCVPSEPAPPYYAPGSFEPARNISEIKNNKETSSDPRVGATPPTYPVDGTVASQPNLCPGGVCRYEEDTYVNNIFFVAWGTGDNQKKTGTNDTGGEAAPLDLYYTRSVDFGDNYLKVPWPVSESSPNYDPLDPATHYEWRYQRLAWGEEEQGECQLKATADGSKAYAIFHQLMPVEDPNEVPTRWYPWEVEESHENDLWFRRLIFWPESLGGVTGLSVTRSTMAEPVPQAEFAWFPRLINPNKQTGN